MATNDKPQQSPAAPPRDIGATANGPAAEPLGSVLVLLKSLIDGLAYPSEDDRPFDVVDWPSDFRFIDLHPSGRADGMSVAEFFDPLCETTDSDRFAALEKALTDNLVDLHVTRHFDGTAEVNIYIVGRTRDPDWHWVGVHTVSVET